MLEEKRNTVKEKDASRTADERARRHVHFFKHQHEEKTRTEGKVDIVDLEGNLELERLSVPSAKCQPFSASPQRAPTRSSSHVKQSEKISLHHLSSSKDDQKVSADSSDDGLLGAERRLSGNPGPVPERGLREVERVPSRGDGGIDGTRSGSPGVEGEHGEG